MADVGGLRKQDLEHASGHTNDAFVFTHGHAKLDDGALRIPPGVGRKTKNMRYLSRRQPRMFV
jgi:hypothetical protein